MTTITIIGQDVALLENASVPARSLIESITPDSFGTFTEYEFSDSGLGTGHFLFNGKIEDQNASFVVSAADIDQVQWVAGIGPGTNLLAISVENTNTGVVSNVGNLFAQTTDIAGDPRVNGTTGSDIFHDNKTSSEFDTGEGGHDTALRTQPPALLPIPHTRSLG